MCRIGEKVYHIQKIISIATTRKTRKFIKPATSRFVRVKELQHGCLCRPYWKRRKKRHVKKTKIINIFPIGRFWVLFYHIDRYHPAIAAVGQQGRCFRRAFTSLFTATSATCVTGLVVRDTYTQWSLFGQIVIILLIQVGGLVL
jgi:hypothetical protein